MRTFNTSYRVRWVTTVAALAVGLMAGCGDSDSADDEPTPTPTGTIVDAAVADASFTTLVAALQATGLDTTLAAEDGTFTVFAPTDAAFEAAFTALGTTAEAFLAEDNLATATAFLTYHVLDSVVDAETAISLDGQSATTVQGEDITISVVDGSVVINQGTIAAATVTEADLTASNGVIHRIDAVLIPPSIASTLAPTPTCGDGVCDDGEECPEDCTPAGPGNLVEETVALGSHTILAEALTAAGLIDTLSGEEVFTVFAPGDAAFQAYFAATNTTKADLLALDNLADILTYHVVNGSVDAATAIGLAGSSATTVQGEDIAITVEDGNVILNGTATVVSPDVAASNGIIHVIDAVILPPSIAPAPEPTSECGDGACDDGEDCPADCDPATPGTIVDIAAADDTFSTLVAALQATGLDATLAAADGTFTVFAPTNAAFDAAFTALGTTAADFLAEDNLTTATAFLTYHVLDSVVDAATAISLDGQSTATVQGEEIAISVVDGAVVINDSATVTSPDVAASNGVIHVIDAVLIPPSIAATLTPPAEAGFCDTYATVCGEWPVTETSCADWWAAAVAGTEGDTNGPSQACYDYHLGVASSMEMSADIDKHCAHAIGAADVDGSAPCTPNLAEVATDGGFSTLVAALEAAQLAQTVATDGPFTVFAPTDEAFSEFIAASVDFTSADDLLAYEGLADVLLYHVVDGVVPAATVVTLTEATTKQGSAVTIDTTDGVVLNGSVTVTATDIYANNGIVHVIDGVLMPPAGE